jgi:cytochrome c-type biogenesis protein CcmH
MKIIYLVLLTLLMALPVKAAEDFYHFDSLETQSRFQDLTSELRCLVCQNQTIAESNAPLASDLRGQIYRQILSGQSDKQIVAYLVSRYGDFILYNPPLSAATIGLWFGPLLFLLSGIGYLFFYLRKHKIRAA